MRGQKELVGNQAKEELTSREQEVLALMAKGWTYKQMAQHLFISTETVKSHLKNIYRKLQASGKVEALNRFRSSH